MTDDHAYSVCKLVRFAKTLGDSTFTGLLLMLRNTSLVHRLRSGRTVNPVPKADLQAV